MSYGMAAALQSAIYQRLVADSAVVAAVGAGVFDVAPTGALPPVYVTLGSEEVRDASDYTGAGAAHELVISVLSGSGGYLLAKAAAVAVSDALADAPLVLERGHLVSLQFLRASARAEGSGQARRVDLRFRARVSA